jgi:class 3 adenylate cyclase
LRVAAVAALLVTVASLVTLPALAPVNLIAALIYSVGLWVSWSGRRGARYWLMGGALFQLSSMIWLTGDVVRVHVHALMGGALAWVVFLPRERVRRVGFMALSLLLLWWGEARPPAPWVDLSGVSAQVLETLRVGNLIFPTLVVALLLEVIAREVRRSEAQLTEERGRSERLLHAVLPRRIVEQLHRGQRAIAERHPEVTVLFADLVGFTPWSAQRPPEEVIALLEQVFSRLDGLVETFGAEKIKTIGDAYMAVAGAPEPRADHAQVMARLALAMLPEVRRIREETGIPVDVRVGLHSGPAVAGVIGSVRFTYDIWGDTVNTASRMESHGEPGRIQVSEETRARLERDFVLEPRGAIEVKGKGQLPAYWLLGARSDVA